MAELKARVGNKGGHHEDPDVVQARFRADLDCMINKAEGEDEVHKSPEDNSLVRLWTKGKVYRYKAWFPLWAQTNMDILLRFGVAPVLLLRVQLGAAWMFLACALLSSAALIENVYAWSELDGATLNATFGNGSAVEATLDELSNFVDGGFSNTSVLLSMTTLGWRLASVPPTQVRVQNWMVAAQLVIVLGFLVWVRRKMRVKSFAADRVRCPPALTPRAPPTQTPAPSQSNRLGLPPRHLCAPPAPPPPGPRDRLRLHRDGRGHQARELA